MQPTTCPNCKANWQGDPIPPKHQSLFGGSTHYSRLIAIYDVEKDRTVAWLCPDCDYKMERK